MGSGQTWAGNSDKLLETAGLGPERLGQGPC